MDSTLIHPLTKDLPGRTSNLQLIRSGLTTMYRCKLRGPVWVGYTVIVIGTQPWSLELETSQHSEIIREGLSIGQGGVHWAMTKPGFPFRYISYSLGRQPSYDGVNC